jgi:serine/threonine protein kinase
MAAPGPESESKHLLRIIDSIPSLIHNRRSALKLENNHRGTLTIRARASPHGRGIRPLPRHAVEPLRLAINSPTVSCFDAARAGDPKKIEHEYSLRDELDSAWAVRPLALSELRGRTTLVLEDPGGETLDRFLSGPMEIIQFLRLAFGLATAVGGLHKRELIHKDVKPTNVLVNPVTRQVRLMGFGIASRETDC